MGKIIKLSFFGMGGVGKTAIIRQAIYGNIKKDTVLDSTIEDIYVGNVETERGIKEKVRFYDTSGLTGLQGSPDLILADGFILVFNPSKSESFDFIVNVKKELDRGREKKDGVIITLANHFFGGHIIDQNLLSRANAWSIREKIRIYNVDVLDKQTLYDPLVSITTKLGVQPTKSSFSQLSISRKKE